MVCGCVPSRWDQDVKLQPITQDAKTSFWLPLSWEVKILGDAAFGAGSGDLVLESAMPLSPSEIAGGTLTAPLVYVGNGSPAVVEHVDVHGKIAVQLVVPQAHMVFERDTVVPQAQALFKRGAVAVFNLMRQPGNEPARDFSNCGGPASISGDTTVTFSRTCSENGAAAGVTDKLRATVTLKTESRKGLKAENAVAVIPGAASDEVIILNAHYDAWFEGAGDNGDGLAVLMALARHFAKPEQRPRRTLALVASAGHHSPGINGPRGFVAANPGACGQSHHDGQHRARGAAQLLAFPQRRRRRLSRSDRRFGRGADHARHHKRIAISRSLFDQGVQRYGVNFVSDRSRMQSGETGGYAAIKGAKLTIMQAPPLYHTTGETLSVISTPGLERIARFLAYFVKEAEKPRPHKSIRKLVVPFSVANSIGRDASPDRARRRCPNGPSCRSGCRHSAFRR